MEFQDTEYNISESDGAVNLALVADTASSESFVVLIQIQPSLVGGSTGT